jgi:transposase InsO family protein
MIEAVGADFPELSVRCLCAILGVSRSGVYERRARPAAGAGGADLALRDAIERLVLAFPGYGYRRVARALQRDGWRVNHKRVLRVMRRESLLCHLERGFSVATTDSRHAERAYPNLLAGMPLTGLDQAWVADISYIRLPTEFVYLACILDAYSRRVVGWELARRIDTALTLAALERALAARRPAPGLVHHSDRGVQYASRAYVERLEAAEARPSMSAVGNPYDNAKAEAFFKTLKREEVRLNEYRDLAEARASLGRFIEEVYNEKRLHSALGYRPPAEFEAIHPDHGDPF